MKYLFIGGAGGFALHTIEKILNLSDTELVISTGRSPARSKAFRLPESKKHIYKQIHLTFETEKLIKVINEYKPEYILNFAALAYATSWHDSHRYYDTNITAVTKVVEALYEKKFLKQFLQIGSSEIYGATNNPAKETDQPNPTSPYAISKLATDLHLLSCFSHNGFPTNIIRPSNCYGRYQLMYRLIPKAIFMVLKGEKFPLEGGGVAEKSFMHAYDLADAIIKILNSKKHGQIYNAGPNKPIKMREIVKTITELMHIKFEDFVENVPGRSTEDSRYWIDSSKIKLEMDWEPKISLKEGIKDVIKWIKNYKDLLEEEPKKFELKA